MNETKSHRLPVLVSIALALTSLTPQPTLALPVIEADDDSGSVETRMTAAAAVEKSAGQPAALAAPITLVRTQSAVRPGELSGGAMTITFTLFNNLPPVIRPALPSTATITDSIAILSTYDYRNDPNTVRNVLISDTLTAAAGFVAASPAVSRTAGSALWSLGDIPPMGSLTATLTFSVTPGGGDATPLDNGALALGTVQGRRVASALPAASLGSEALGPYLSRTPDADTADAYMLRAASAAGHDPAVIFATLTGMGFESYPGSLRGTRGTLWAGAGSALDKTSLLIAMLRASGVPARYRHGTLGAANAQALIGSMFPAPTRIQGHLQPGAPTADPLNDAALIAEVSDHWWAEAYLSGVWTNLDPAFSSAAMGSTFNLSTAIDGTDRIAEIPDALRHKVTLRLKAEQYSNYAFGLSSFYPLSHTFNAVELAGRPVALAHVVNPVSQPGLVFATSTTDYLPYFIVGDDPAAAEIITGQGFQDLVSSFASATQVHVGEWLQFDLRDPAGATQTYEREIVDLIGYDKRQNGGSLSFAAGTGSQPLLQTTDMFSTWFWGGRVPFEALQRGQAAAINLAPLFNADLQAINTLQGVAGLTAQQEAQYNAALSRVQLNVAARLALVGASFAVRADDALDYFASGAQVKAYYAAPRIVTVGSRSSLSQTVNSDSFTLDLRSTSARALVYPGQSSEASFALQQLKGHIESQFEQEALEQATGLPAVSSARVISEALAQGVPVVRITDALLDQLAALSLSEQARARITTAALAGREVLVPVQGISITGQLRYAWFETDAVTGETVGVMENGLHTAAIEYSSLLSNGLKALTAGALGFLVGLWGALTPVLVGKLGGDAAAARSQMQLATKSADTYAKAFCIGPSKIATKSCGYAYKGGKKAGASMVQAGDPPLADMLYGPPAGQLPTHAPARGAALVAATANLPAGPISATLSATLVALHGAGDASTYAGTSPGLAVGGAYTGATNLATGAALSVASGGINVDGASGSLLLGGIPVGPPARFAIASYSGTLSLADGGATDTAALNGSGDLFALRLSAAASTIDPIGAAAFSAQISTTASTQFTVTAQGPDGWQMAVTSAGVITARPPSGAAAGQYPILVQAQSRAYPRLGVSAVHTVTVSAYQGVQVDVSPDPLTSVPLGAVLSDNAANDSNDGRMQLGGAAFNVDITNTSNITRAFGVTVTGLTPAWVILGGKAGATTSTVSLPPGGIGRLGMYISPTLPLPAIGTAFPFVASARGVENPALTASDNATFTIASTPYAYLHPAQPLVYSTPGATTTLDLHLTNAGNAAGVFAITFVPPWDRAWTADLAPSMSAASGVTASQPITVHTPSGAIGDERVVAFATSSAGYAPTAYVLVVLTTPNAACAYRAATGMQTAGAGQAAEARALAGAIQALEAAPNDAALRAAAAAAIDALAAALGTLPPLPAASGLSASAAALRSHSDPLTITSDLAQLCGTLTALAPQVGAATQHAFTAQFTPGSAAALPGRGLTYTFWISNSGALSTSFWITLTSGGFGSPVLLAPVLAAGGSAQHTVVISQAGPGFVPIYADVSASTGLAALPVLRESAIASASFITPVAAVLSVTPAPAFVDPGASATSVSAVIANSANWRMTALATLRVIAPSGAVSATVAAPVALVPGDTSTVDFGSINTSGFATGTYTLTVSAAVTDPAGLAGGAPASGYALLGVGQALFAQAAVEPVVAAPGSVTVTTVVTTYAMAPPPPVAALLARGSGSAGLARRLPGTADGSAADIAQPANPPDAPPIFMRAATANDPTAGLFASPLADPPASPLAADFAAGGPVTRTDAGALEVAKTGTWTNVSSLLASSGAYSRSSVVSSTMSHTFTGTWVTVGFLAGTDGRNFEVFIDGASQGVIDSYANSGELPRSRAYGGLVGASHTISVFVLATKNAFASATAYAKIDYFDAWSGAAMSDGTFEHTAGRVLLAGGWTTQTLAMASGGNYGRSGLGSGVAWFAFTGDSVSLRMLRDFDANAGVASAYVDGMWKADIDLESAFANTGVTTATVSFNGLGGGAHVLTWLIRRGFFISLDAFITPGEAPFYAPPARPGVARDEERDPAVLYNGLPFTATKSTWDEASLLHASDGYVARTSTAGDTVSRVFSGTWVSLGYLGDANTGRVEVFIDGASRGVIDTYANDTTARQAVYAGLAAVTHTISATLLVTRNAFANLPGYFDLDYIDTWDGSPLADGRFQEDDGRIWYGESWTRVANGGAEGGFHAQSGLGSGVAWFAFTGDSVMLQPVHGFNNAGVMQVTIDGAPKARIDLEAPISGTANFTRAYSFAGLGAGPHEAIVQIIRGYYASLDVLETPGTAPFYAPPARAGVVRYEEWDPVLRYNGAPLTATETTWGENSTSMASDGHTRSSATASDTLALAFSGTWVSLGYVARSNAGRAEVFIDGASRGVLDTYGNGDQPRSAVYAGLSPGAHVISATVLGTRNAFASAPGNLHFDYIDVWDGTALADGIFEDTSPRLWFESGWNRSASGAAGDGYFAQSGLGAGAGWFAFTGDSVTVQAMAGIANVAELTAWIDGAWMGHHDLYSLSVATRTLSFGGLGAGPHVLTLAVHRGFYLGIDRVETPGSPPFVSTTRSGVYRLEEDDPAILYDGAPLDRAKGTWDNDLQPDGSNVYGVRDSVISDTVSLTFTGRYAGAGFLLGPDGRQAEIFLDGASQGVVDTYGAADGVLTRVYGDLISATHVISFAILATVNPSATGATKYLRFDYFDVGDGTPVAQGLFQPGDARVPLSNDWGTSNSPNAISGTFIEDGTSAWFLFTGMTVTVIAVTDAFTTAKAEVLIDGVSAGVLDLYYPYGRVPLPFTFGGLSDAPHVLRVRDASGGTRRAALDAFDTRATPFAGAAMVEWAFTAPISPEVEIFDTSPVVGDLDGNGLADIVATTTEETCLLGGVCSFTNRSVYAMRGDGSGLIFSRTITGTSAFIAGDVNGGIGSPALVDLDAGPGIEIVVPSGNGLHAYRNDGTELWWIPDVQGNWASSVAVGNLDDDDAPEIVATHFSSSSKRVHVVQPDGAVTWVYTFPTTAPGPRMPVLADMNGDGRLDILIASGNTLYLFQNQTSTFGLAYTATLGLAHYGAPAVADIDGDGLPEVVIGWTGVVQALEHNLASKWVYTTTGIYPSSVSIANLDADPSPEIVIFSKTSVGSESGRVFALNHDGTLLWSQPAKDTTNSSAGVAMADLDGDGRWEVVWNGSLSGTVIFNGSDGAVLFNDPAINSGTVNETPVVADVDNDGRGELVLADNDSLVVLGFDAAWAPARPVWNQHSYHITNIADDLSVPPREPASWTYHNTYRTQSPIPSPLPVYGVTVSHMVAAGVQVLTPTFSAPFSAAAPVYVWGYKHYAYEPEHSVRFSAVISGLLPGEVRAVSQGTIVSYTVEAGRNRIQLPPLFATGAHILALAPPSRTVAPGASAAFALRLSNPSALPLVYTLTLAGLPSSVAVSLPLTISIAAGATVTQWAVLGTAPDAAPGLRAFVARVDTSSGGSESAPADLTIGAAHQASLAPAAQTVEDGAAAFYTLTVTNTAAGTRVFAVDVAGGGIAHAPAITLSANSSGALPVTVSAASGPPVRALRATVTDTASGAVAEAEALLIIAGLRAVTSAFSPFTATAGLDTDVFITLPVTNTGTLSDVYDIALHAPPGWTIESVRTAAAQDAEALTPFVFNTVNLRVRINAGGAAAAGLHPISATVTSRMNAAVGAVAAGAVQVLGAGVRARLSPALQAGAPGQTTTWTLVVTNTGASATTYVITGAGGLAGLMRFSPASVTVGAAGTAAVGVVITTPVWALAGLQAVAMRVTAQTAPQVTALATGALSVATTAGALASLSPGSAAITRTLPAYYLFTITNTGNAYQTFDLTAASAWPVVLGQDRLVLPPGLSGQVLVQANPAAAGSHGITVTAVSAQTTVAATTWLQSGSFVRLPTVRRDP